MADPRLSSSQLMTIDAARISSIIEEALEKLSFLASITPDVMAHRDELSQIVGDEITRIISEQRALEMQYENLVAQRNALKAQSNKAKVEENQLAIREVARALRESTKELTRNLKGNPNIAENLSKIQAERSSLQNLLSKTLRELRESSFSTLTTTVNEEKLRTDMLLEVIANEKKMSASVKSLQEQLARERAQHETDIEDRTATITKLKEELQDLRTKTSIETQYLHAESRARGETSDRAYTQDERAILDEIERLRKQLDIEKRVNTDSEDFLRRKYQRLQAELDEWSTRFETDLEERERELDALNTARASDLVKLNQLRELYEKDVSEKRARDDGARAAEEAERKRVVELDRTTRAATAVQSAFRGFRVRVLAKGGGRGGKKKKGGKGGKGGKKGKKGKK